MNEKDKQRLHWIFLYAHVVDVDFSCWDKVFDIVVVAEELPARRGKLPLYTVSFLEPKRVSLEFRHAAMRGRKQWNIFSVKIRQRRDALHVVLGGYSGDPLAEIVCSDVRIRPVNAKVLNLLFPGWGKPGSPLIRPGIAALLRQRSTTKRRKRRRSTNAPKPARSPRA